MYICLCLVSRRWRGYWWRKNHPWPQKVIPHIKRKIPLKFGMETYRRVWARSNFIPEGGWKGRLDHIAYDMWEHADRPPAGRDFGLKTYKVN